MLKILFLGKNCRDYYKQYSKKSPELKFTCANPGCNRLVLHKHGCFWRVAVTKRWSLSFPSTAGAAPYAG